MAILCSTTLLLGFQPPGGEKARFELATEATAYQPGDTARLAVRMTIEDGWHTNSHEPSFDYLIATAIRLKLPSDWDEATYQYPAAELKTFAFENEPLSVYEGEVDLLASFAVPSNQPIGAAVPIDVELIYQACDDRSCAPPVRTGAVLDLSIDAGGQPTGHPAFATAASRQGSVGSSAGSSSASSTGVQPAAGGWLTKLALALLGGLILNAMPCVLPVLSLKLLGLVKSAGQSRSAVVAGSLATSAGIVVSFIGLALAAIFAKQAGAAVGWGVQFQNPLFVAALALIVLLFCLNLWGLFEIQLPMSLARAGSSGPREGLGGHFLSGLFATLMATPCSAPFLGSAVGFALSQNSATILVMFIAIGIGMALPYLLLAVAPGATAWIPKPGAWMVRLRGFLGFLLAGAAVWLLYVLSQQVAPETVAFFELCLLLTALFVWLRSDAASGWVRHLATVGLLVTIVSGLALARPSENGAGGATSRNTASEPAKKLLSWQKFDRAEADRLAATGRLVFVDVTADWCFTCKVNERLVLETEPIAEAFERHQVIAMKADWTNRDDSIGQFLADHGRYGIPFYALYRPEDAPHVFGELLTQQGLVDVLEASARVTRSSAESHRELETPSPVKEAG